MRKVFFTFILIGLAVYYFSRSNNSSTKLNEVNIPRQTHEPNHPDQIKVDTPQKHIAPQKVVLNESFTSDDPCFVKLSTENALKIEQFKEKFFSDPNNPLNRWLYDSKALVAPSSTKNSLDSLYRGLFAANLLLGRENEKPNLDYAAQALWESFEMDPKNAEPLFYLALLEKERNNFDEAKKILKMINDEHLGFQSSLTKIYQNVYSYTESPADMLGALEVFSELPIANVSKIAKLLNETEQNHLGYLLMSEALDENRIIPDLDYDQLAYAIGRSTQIRLLANIDNSIPTLMQLQEIKQKHPQSIWLTKQSNELDKDCTLENLEAVFKFYKTRGNTLSQ